MRRLARISASLAGCDFLGYVGDMPALYARADLVVQSSLTEGLPNVMLEVAYLGVPVVATDVGRHARGDQARRVGLAGEAGSRSANW